MFQAGPKPGSWSQVKQSSTDFGGAAERAIDGLTDGDYHASKSVTHTSQSDDPGGVDFGMSEAVDRIVTWNRTDGGLYSRLDGATIGGMDETGKSSGMFGKEAPRIVRSFRGWTKTDLLAGAILSYRDPDRSLDSAGVEGQEGRTPGKELASDSSDESGFGF